MPCDTLVCINLYRRIHWLFDSLYGGCCRILWYAPISYTSYYESIPLYSPVKKIFLRLDSFGAWREFLPAGAFGYPNEVAVPDLAGIVLRLFSVSASDSDRLRKRCSGWLHATVATVVSTSSSLICLVAFTQIE